MVAEDSELTLKRFNPKKLEELRLDRNQGASTVLFVGSKRTGKTTMIQDILYYVRNIPRGIIVTGSISSAESFSEFFPKEFIFDTIDKTMIRRLNDIISTQEDIRKEGKASFGEYTSLLLFDDCGYDKKFANEKVIKKIFMNGRHYNLFGCYSVQSCKSIGPDLRGNADFIFIHREPGVNERKKLWQEFASIIPTFKMFCDIMDVCTDNYGCLVIDKTTASNKISDSVFFYKAKYPARKFKMGCKEIWNFHKKCEEKEKKENPNHHHNYNSKNKKKMPSKIKIK